jgi:GH24 family phage-related lysozyme (muramidase)/LAS superfamily LD-carboxypeptidase LdcB
MANRITNKIGCEAGRTKIVDPNNFSGFDSESNISVPLEDLNISVVLSTTRMGRTVLTSSDDENTVGTRESSKTMTINFIEGSDVSGRKVLTTNYTDLTSLGSDSSNDEALGITNIEIDFNSSYAPMVNIDFVDVRGSAIFQNEQNISGNNTSNKYSTFFQLPYPKFELEIKGYYGKPVTYCLHMLKFNSKFNSKTGNFEISCQFIGYTYAMLSDMLLGYLKAIPYTKIGEEIHNRYNDERGYEVIRLVTLMENIQKINGGVEKIAQNSKNADSFGRGNEAIEKLNNIEAIINSLGSNLDLSREVKDKHFFVVKKNIALTDEQTGYTEDYKVSVVEKIKEFKEMNSGGNLDENYFLLFDKVDTNKGLYTSVTRQMFDPTKNDLFDQTTLSKTLGSPNNLEKLKKEIFSYLKDYEIADNVKLDIYNFNGLYDKISAARLVVNEQINSSKKELALELKENVAESLGFDPTVRRIIEIFTNAIEVFMESIYTVSTAAEEKGDGRRILQLESKFGVEIINSDIKKEKLQEKEFYAWPAYREKDQLTKTYVDKYLGEDGVLEKPDHVDELVFIDDLLDAFIFAQKASDDVLDDITQSETTWFPISPIDTSIFIDTEPYSRTELLSKQDVMRLMLIRGMTFLAYTNDQDSLSVKEIETMAIAEADAIVRGVTNKDLKQIISNISASTVANTTGTINGVSRNVVKLATSIDGKPVDPYYYYDYIYKDPNNFKIIPIQNGFNNKTWGDVSGGVNTQKNYANLQKDSESGNLFLTNYSSSFGSAVQTNVLNGFKSPIDQHYKYLDGGTYIKILTLNEYNKTKQLYPVEGGVETKISPLKLSVLNNVVLTPSQVSEAGFNVFAGPLGMQEFSLMDFGNGIQGPLSFAFYRDKRPGLAHTRKASGGNSSIFDLSKNPQTVPENQQNINWGDIISKKLHNKWGSNRELLLAYYSGYTSDLTFPFLLLPFQYGDPNAFEPDFIENTESKGISLFGSTLYYNQTSEYSKAMLFLHTLPFVGNGIDQNSQSDGLLTGEDWPETINYIRNIFSVRGGFVTVPRLWCAYIGSILWRLSTEAPELTDGKQTGGGSGTNDPIIWRKNKLPDNTIETYKEPTKFSYIVSLYDKDKGYTGPVLISPRDLLRTLPQQVKNEFRKIFFNFVNGSDNLISWDTIKNGLEIWDGNGVGFETLLNNSYTNLSQINNLKNKDKYEVIIPQNILGEKDNFRLELKDGYGTNDSVKTLINALVEPLIIANNNYAIWRGPQKEKYGTDGDYKTNLRGGINVYKEIFDKYFEKLTNHLEATADSYSPTNEDKQIRQEIFGTANEDVIKLLLYKTCKNVHDKWLAGTTDINNIIFQCGANNRSNTDSKLAIQYKSKTSPKLIDSFRFISRSFKDIGDKLYVNPLPINDFLLENPNTSSYSAISQLLSDNNFDFIALPSFINFKNKEEVEAIFQPYGSYTEAIAGGTCGPSFVCAYVGNKSQHLDYSTSDYPNDGFDLRCLYDEKGVNINPSIPDDFKTDDEPYEDAVGAFVVRYSQQNQNLFKDISLDQSEFTETDESLQIQDDISQKGGANNRSIAGQNLYNVYSVRSYTAQIEMMGNAMIQPMMYFQLDNIPMFHGAYMITRVKHLIKPNHMSTNFTGVRIRYAETPLITALDLYMSFIDNLGITGGNSSGSGSGSATSGSFPPIVRTIMDNGGFNGDIEKGDNIKLTQTPKINNVGNTATSKQMLDEAVLPLKEMLEAFVIFAKDQNYPKIGENYLSITSLYRSQTYQKSLYDACQRNPNCTKGSVARPGSSNHSWGIAVDIQMIVQKTSPTNTLKKGNFTPIKASAAKEGFNFEYNTSLKWFMDNSYKFGFIIPINLRDGVGVDEFWHFEYHGTAAKCLYDDQPTTYGYTPDYSKPYKPVVKNPKNKDGNPAVYSDGDCKYVYVKGVADGGDNGPSGSSYPNIKPNQKQIEMVNNLKGGWVERASEIIKSFEGFSTKTTFDQDKYRGGYGTDNIVTSSGAAPQKVTKNTVFTEQTALLTLQYDINVRFKNSVIDVLGQTNWDKLNDNQKASIISYTYNTGSGTLNTRGIKDDIDNSNYDEAAKAIMGGPITGKKDGVLKGLIIRRKVESMIFSKKV